MSSEAATLVALLSPKRPTPFEALAALSSGLVSIDSTQAQTLLQEWATRWSFDSGDKQAMEAGKDELLLLLMDKGANPWKAPDVMARWIGEYRNTLLTRADLVLDKQMEGKIATECLPQAVASANQVALEVLLGSGVPQRAGGREGNYPLHVALDTKSVSLLMRHGADPSVVNAARQVPIEHWCNPWGKPDVDFAAQGRRIMHLASEAMRTPQSLLQPGFDLAPLLLAACGDPSAALACAGLNRTGLETVPCRDFRLGASPLAAWSWSALRRGQSRPGAWPSRMFLERCFQSRDAIWDHEWVYAVAALDAMKQSRAGAVEGMAAPIRARQLELMALPGLGRGEGSRWDEALSLVSAHLGWVGMENQFARKVSQQFLDALAHGRKMPVEPSSVQWLNQLASNHPQMIEQAVREAWSVAIPPAFWERQGNACPGWIAKVNQEKVISHVEACIKRGVAFPVGLVPTERWPAPVLAALDAVSLQVSTPDTPASRPGRRM